MFNNNLGLYPSKITMKEAFRFNMGIAFGNTSKVLISKFLKELEQLKYGSKSVHGGNFLRRLAVILTLSAVWSIWKAVPLHIWPVLSSWNYLLKHLGPYPLIYIVLCYIWVAWAFGVLIKRYRGEVSWKGVAIGLLLALPFVVALNLLRGIDITVVILTLATFSVFGGVVEEIIYRGLLLDTLVEKLNVKVAVIVQSLIFGLSHPWSLGAVIAGFVFGIVVSVLRLKIGIGCSIAFHWLINATTHV